MAAICQWLQSVKWNVEFLLIRFLICYFVATKTSTDWGTADAAAHVQCFRLSDCSSDAQIDLLLAANGSGTAALSVSTDANVATATC